MREWGGGLPLPSPSSTCQRTSWEPLPDRQRPPVTAKKRLTCGENSRQAGSSLCQTTSTLMSGCCTRNSHSHAGLFSSHRKSSMTPLATLKGVSGAYVGGGGGSNVLEWPYTVGGSGVPPLDPPLPPPLPFQRLRLTTKILLRRLWCQEDLSLKNFGPPSAGTIGGPWEEGGPSQTPLPPPPFRPPLPPPLSNTSWGGGGDTLHSSRSPGSELSSGTNSVKYNIFHKREKGGSGLRTVVGGQPQPIGW